MFINKIFPVLLCVLGVFAGYAAEIVRLWDGNAPFAKGNRTCDIPELELYLPSVSNGKATPAVIICPGGGYRFLAKEHEGVKYARFLNEHGIAGLVLKYRIGSDVNGGYRYPVPMLDAKRAVRLARFNAAKWNIDPQKIGIMGSSAGGHLAAMTAVKNDSGNPEAADPVEKFSCRPDFAILCYAQTSMDKKYGKCCGSRKHLLGEDETLIPEVAAYAHVDGNTPPSFVWHTIEDGAVPFQNALDFADALARNKVPFSLHIYVRGKHGVGLGRKGVIHPWSNELIFWLKEIGVL